MERPSLTLGLPLLLPLLPAWLLPEEAGVALVGGHRAVLLVCLQQLRVVLHELLRAMVVVVFMDGLVRGTEDIMKMLMDTKINKRRERSPK